MNDLQAINHIKEGELSYFEFIVRKYNTPLFRVGMSYLKNKTDVEDAMQNTYMKAFEKIDTFNNTAQFSTWLTRIMINECLMILRKNSRVKINNTIPVEQPVDYDLPLKMILNKEVRTILEDAIIRLPKKYRSVYIFREIKELSTKETAELLSISTFNVKIRLFRAKAELKKKVSTYIKRNELFEFYAPRCNRLTQKVMNLIFQSNVKKPQITPHSDNHLEQDNRLKML